MGSHRINETVLCLDSFNRDERRYPDTNDCIIDLKQRYEMQSLVLGSFEFPHNQYLIEDDWATFCFDVGLSLGLHPALGYESRIISFNFPFQWSIAMVPAPYTLMKKDPSKTKTYRTTKHDNYNKCAILEQFGCDAYPYEEIYQSHGLCPSSVNIFQDNLKLHIGDHKSISGKDFTVISSHQISINQHMSEKEWSDYPEYALLQATAANTRTFKHPGQIADHLNVFCQNPPSFEQDGMIGEHGALLRYNLIELGKRIKRLSFQYDYSALTMILNVNFPENDFINEFDVRDKIGIDKTRGKLLEKLNIELPEQAIGKSYFQSQSIGKFPVCNFSREKNYMNDYQVNDKIVPVSLTIPSANYEPEFLKSTLEYYINQSVHHNIPEKIDTSQGHIEVRTVGESSFTKVPVEAFFAYHPRSIAMHIENSFSLQIPNAFSVTYENDRFHIARKDSKKFKLKWPTGDNDQNIRERLGFSISNVMKTKYTSDVRKYNNIPSFISIFDVYRNQHFSTVRKFTFESKPKHNSSFKLSPYDKDLFELKTDIHPNTPSITITKHDDTLALKLDILPEEVPVIIKLRKPHSDIYGYVSVTSQRTEIQLLEDIQFDISDILEIICLDTDTAALNLYFPSTITRGIEPSQNIISQTFEVRKSWSRLAEILGFHGGCHSSCMSDDLREILQAPGQWCFDAPSYILIDLGLQHSSLTTHHRSGDSLFKHMFGKIVLYPPFSEKRHVPVQAISTGLTVLSSLHVRIYNPWHQLYHFHGRNWSMTLILSSGQLTAMTDL